MSQEDPVLRSSRREALVVLCVWLGALAWTVGYCWRHGYGRPAEGLTFVLGFPDWVFWGIVVPWAACILFSFWFAFRFMTDEDLGEDPELSAGEHEPPKDAEPPGGSRAR